MKIIKSLTGGLAGALALNILHQTVKLFVHDAPRVDLVGEEALSKGLKALGAEPPAGNALFAATLAADVLSNAAYFSLAGFAKKRHLIAAGTTAGLAAGLGTLALTRPLGLHDAPVNRTVPTQLMTVAWYAFGGFVAGLTIKALRK